MNNLLNSIASVAAIEAVEQVPIEDIFITINDSIEYSDETSGTIKIVLQFIITGFGVFRAIKDRKRKRKNKKEENKKEDH